LKTFHQRYRGHSQQATTRDLERWGRVGEPVCSVMRIPVASGEERDSRSVIYGEGLTVEEVGGGWGDCLRVFAVCR
jgi:hypothetical protein